ncbi:hypothetical protein KNE206_17860 [Kitasatospora sp. NE20-6]|uniref:hypothetical protein n=1 Tax=Kitasatospora sp. NE20-6 TaxID=2859066 RepID=UPI0034DC379B
MLIPGYEDAPLTPGDDLPARPGFWTAHLRRLAPDGGPGPDHGLDDADADTEAALAALTDPAAWPVLRLPLPHGCTILVVHRNATARTGTDILLSRPGRRHPSRLARTGDASDGPGLTWQALTTAARRPGDGHGITGRHARLLLLLPALRRAVLPSDAAVTVASALTAVGVPLPHRAALAAALLPRADTRTAERRAA